MDRDGQNKEQDDAMTLSLQFTQANKRKLATLRDRPDEQLRKI